MEDFFMFGNIGLIIGVVIGLAIILITDVVMGPKVKTSGQYLTYENVIYKQVNQEELDNIIVLEVK